jgi:hypothetical protein
MVTVRAGVGVQDLETLQGNCKSKVILSRSAEIWPATLDRLVDNDVCAYKNMHT